MLDMCWQISGGGNGGMEDAGVASNCSHILWDNVLCMPLILASALKSQRR